MYLLYKLEVVDFWLQAMRKIGDIPYTYRNCHFSQSDSDFWAQAIPYWKKGVHLIVSCPRHLTLNMLARECREVLLTI